MVILLRMAIKNFSIIFAHDLKNGIGKNNTLPWKHPEDMRYFQKITSQTDDPEKQNAVIMGRLTFKSMNKRPLKNRVNLIIGKGYLTSFQSALENASQNEMIEKIFIIGGSRLYQEAIEHPNCEKLHITTINKEYDCDTFFEILPAIMKKFKLVSQNVSNNGILVFSEYSLNFFLE